MDATDNNGMFKKLSNILFMAVVGALALFLLVFLLIPDFEYEKVGRELFKEDTNDPAISNVYQRETLAKLHSS